MRAIPRERRRDRVGERRRGGLAVECHDQLLGGELGYVGARLAGTRPRRWSPQFDNAPLIDKTVSRHYMSVARDIHVPHDVAAARNRPTLEFFRCRVEAYDRVRLGVGFVVVDRTLREGDAVWLRLRSAWRLPFLDLPGRQVEPA